MSDGELMPESDDKYPLDWESVEAAALLAFDIWVGQPELAWAKKAFSFLPGQGLSRNNDSFNEHVAIFRFLVLAGIYHDFCDAAWDETSWITYAEWCEPFEVLDRFVVGQLFAWLADWGSAEAAGFSHAIDRLVEAERDIVVNALRNGFGGIAGLYASLWRSRLESGEVGPDEGGENASDYECFEADDVGKVKAYDWVSEGCPRLGEL
jgi:hypothetical protein